VYVILDDHDLYRDSLLKGDVPPAVEIQRRLG
jgi:hypothetical protein